MDAYNVTAYNFSQTFNKQIENANAILTSERLDKLDELAETLKALTINNAGYYVSDSASTNEANSDYAKQREDS